MDWSLRGIPVLEGKLVLPVAGRWVAELTVDGREAITGAVTLGVGTTVWRGVVSRGAPDDGRDVWRGRVVGGAGGLDRDVPPRSWQGAQPARGLVEELLMEVGETLAPASSLEAHLPRWSRVEGAAHRALADLAKAVGARWRVTPEGSVWVGVDAWPELVLPDGELFELLSDDPARATSVYAPSGAWVWPGQTFDGRRVGGVEYALREGRERVTIWWAS